jgi:hypothetical protein
MEHLSTRLGAGAFDTYVATGTAMELGEAVAYAAHQQIGIFRQTS